MSSDLRELCKLAVVADRQCQRTVRTCERRVGDDVGMAIAEAPRFVAGRKVICGYVGQH